jgi:hypothetical protein
MVIESVTDVLFDELYVGVMTTGVAFAMPATSVNTMSNACDPWLGVYSATVTVVAADNLGQ